MLKAFFDTSIFLASLRSPDGGSSEVLRYAVVEAVAAFVSDDVLDELARHIHEVGPGLLTLSLRYLAAIPFSLISVSVEEVAWATTFTDIKDRSIVAAAAKADVDYLVTLDKKHLLNPRAEIEAQVHFKIVTPGFGGTASAISSTVQ